MTVKNWRTTSLFFSTCSFSTVGFAAYRVIVEPLNSQYIPKRRISRDFFLFFFNVYCVCKELLQLVTIDDKASRNELEASISVSDRFVFLHLTQLLIDTRIFNFCSNDRQWYLPTIAFYYPIWWCYWWDLFRLNCKEAIRCRRNCILKLFVSSKQSFFSSVRKVV